MTQILLNYQLEYCLHNSECYYLIIERSLKYDKQRTLKIKHGNNHNGGLRNIRK